MVATAGKALSGRIAVPGDKSISHRSLLLGTLAVGHTEITGLLNGEDVMATAAACRMLGAAIERQADGRWTIDGVGIGGLREAASVLDLGNSGTGVRLLMGLVATHPITTLFTGDASLVKRPMARVTKPLEMMGAGFFGRSGGRLPLAVIGTENPMPISYQLPVASAQVKSAILLAALNTPGHSTIIEPIPTRDHSERMLRAFGADVRVEDHESGGRKITIIGQPELRATSLTVPGDPSSAAFPLVAALLLPGSEIIIETLGLNPLRAGLIETLQEMGAQIRIENMRSIGDEPVGDLHISASDLIGITVPAARAASQIDEYPILAVAAALACGTTVLQGLEELRVKESDRLSAIARGLAAAGVKVAVENDSLTIEGTGGAAVPGGVTIAANLDHRIAMAFLVLGLRAAAPIRIDDGSTIDTSFPGFAALMGELGADIRVERS